MTGAFGTRQSPIKTPPGGEPFPLEDRTNSATLFVGVESGTNMKTETIIKLVASLTVATGTILAGCAHRQNAVQTQDTYPSKTNNAYMTGSYLPQDVNRSGAVTDGKNNVRVLDGSDLNRSGGADVGQALRLQGVTP